MKILDLALASAATLVVGGSAIFALEWVSIPLRPALFFAAALAGISIGIGYLRYRRHEHLIPKAAIFTVVMMAAFIYLDFLIAWYRGRVEL
jgi:hypothetical protein